MAMQFGAPSFGGKPPTNTASSAGDQTGDRPMPSPWWDYASMTVPDSHELVLWWAQYLWLTDGTYSTALKRVAAHFMTIIEFPELEPGEESAWRDFFNHHMNYRRELLACAHDFLAYGNLFVTPYLPFRRFCVCQDCYVEQPISEVEYELDLIGQEPYAIWKRKSPCPRCQSSKPYKIVDRRDNDLSKVVLNRYNPAEIEIGVNRFSRKKDIYWKIPEDERRDIYNKARIHIDDTPLDVIHAVAANGLLKFNPDLILHVEEPTISGVRTRGWGIPGSIANFRAAWLNQVANKTDQAIMTDYTLGIRMMSPAPTPGGVDPMMTRSMDEFVNNISGIVREHRLNPTSFHASPYPMQYQFMGGEGATLLPPEKLKFRQGEYLNQLGIPVEYHSMNLSSQAAPMALRLFESYWQAIPSFYNEVLNWLVRILTRSFNLDSTTVKMQKTTVVDDSNYKALLLQLMSGNQLSAQTALEPLGIDAHAEVKKVYQHQDYVAKIQGEFDEKAKKREELNAFKGTVQQPNAVQLAQQQQQGGQPPAGAQAGGVPMGGMPGGGQTPQSLQEISDQANQLAQQLISMPEFDRKQQLKQLREGNKQLHQLVTAELETLRGQARSQGANMLLNQPQPQG